MEINENIFELNYTKNIEKNVIFILFYENTGKMNISITYPTSNSTTFSIDPESEDDAGYIFFPYITDGSYQIEFKDNLILKESLVATFKLVSTEKPFSLDINKKITLGFMFESEIEPTPLIFYFENFTNDNYIKKIKNFKIEDDYRYISEEEGEYKLLKNELIYFQKNVNYLIKLEFFGYENQYYMREFTMEDFDSNLIQIDNLSLGLKIYNSSKKFFLKIDLNDYNKLYAKPIFGSLNLDIVGVESKEQLNNFPIGIQYLEFEFFSGEKIEKKEECEYFILLIDIQDFDDYESYIYFVEEVPLQLNEEKKVNEEISPFYKLHYEKKSDKNEVFYLFYEREKNDENELIEIDGSINIIENIKGTLNYIIKESGDYYFFFPVMSNYTYTFRVVSSEYEFTIDAKKELYLYNISRSEKEKNFNTQIKFNITNLDKNYYKLFSPIYNLENIISYSIKDNDFVNLTNPLLLLEEGESIKFKINTEFIHDEFRLSNLNENDITNIGYENYEYNTSVNKIFKIDFLKTSFFKIEEKGLVNYYLSYATEEQYKNIPKDLEKLSFNLYEKNIFEKPDNFDYGILIAEILTNTTLNVINLIKPLDFNSEEIFNSSNNHFQFEIKNSDNNDKLLFIYKANEEFKMEIYGPDDYVKTETFGKNNSTESYPFEKYTNGIYNINFYSKNKFEGTFKIVKISEEINFDINDKIQLNSFTTDYKPEPIVIVLNVDNLKEEVYKKLIIGENNDLLNLTQISYDEEGNYENLNSNYYAFQKEQKKYKLKIDFKELGNNTYEFGPFSLDTFKYLLDDFKYKTLNYKGPAINHFIKIDFNQTSKIKVNIVKENNAIIKIAYHNDTVQMKNILNDLVYEDLKDNLKDKFILDKGYPKAILMIEFSPGESEIEFTNGENKNNKKDDDDDDNNLVLILAIAIPVGIILILLIIFLVCRYRKKKNEININEGETRDQEMLMPQGE